ncbi:MAG: hypothetical protein ACK5W9_06805 [Bdellovibrionales bacterium]
MLQPHLCWALILSIAVFTAPLSSWARDLTYFHHDSHLINSLTVQNTSPVAEDLWLLIYEKKFIEEIHFEIPHYSKKTIFVSDYKTANQQISLLTKSEFIKTSGAWSQNSSTAFRSTQNLTLKDSVEITNLGLRPQALELLYKNSENEIILKETLMSLEHLNTQSVKLKILNNFKSLEIKALYPLYIHPSTNLIPTQDKEPVIPVDQVQFLAEYEPGSQFIIGLTDPELIEKARQEIRNPQGLIIFGELSLNHLKWNKNPSLHHQPRWSWSLQKVTSLEPLAADWCQVYPEMLERMLSVLLDQVQVCFRGSQIIAEWNPDKPQPRAKKEAP